MKKNLQKSARKLAQTKKRIKKSSFCIPDKLRTLIINDAERFLSFLGFNNYRVRIFYKSKPIEHESSDLTNEDMVFMVTASSHVDTRYLRLDISIYPFLVEQWNNRKLDTEEIHTIIAHEVSHLATHSLYKLAISVFKNEEELTDSWESLTSLIGRLLNKIDRLQKTDTKLDK